MKPGNKYILVLVMAALPLLNGCYKFNAITTGTLKTVSVQYFPSYAPLAPPTLSPAFSEALKDAFVSQTRLELVNKGGDAQFEGSITSYYSSPLAIQSNDQAALNRLTITVTVRYYNKQDDTKNFEQSFTRFADYQSSQSLASVESELIKEINRQLVDDIFNRAFNNW